MTHFNSLRCFSGAALLFVVAAFHAATFSPAAYSQASDHSPAVFEQSPLSASILMARAISQGRIQPPGFHRFGQELGSAGSMPPVLDCTPVPCAVNNQQASEGGMPVNDTPITGNLLNLDQLLSGGADYNCPQLASFYFSSDGGSTWNVHCSDVLPAFPVGNGGPGVAFDLNNVAYATTVKTSTSGTTGVIALQTSSDRGVTWSAIAEAVSSALGGLSDGAWMQIDNSSTSPRANSIYISTTQFNKSETQSEIWAAHSTDRGATFTDVAVSPRSVLPKVVQFSNLATAANGTVYVTWLACTANGPTGNCGGTSAELLFSASSDGGTTWSKQAVMAKTDLAPDACSCAYYGSLPNTSEPMSNIPVIAVDDTTGPKAGTLYVTYYNWTGTFTQVEVISSANGGATWSAPSQPAPPSDTHDQFFPWIGVSDTSKVGVTWLDRRNDPANISYESFSGDSSNGVTFSDIQLAPELSNPFNDGFGGTFLGDFAGNIWTQKTLYAAWPDTRSGINAQNEVGGLRVH